jgi:hypothetical protein
MPKPQSMPSTPQPRQPGTITVTAADAGTVIAASTGFLKSIQVLTPPHGAAGIAAFDPITGLPTSGYLTITSYDPASKRHVVLLSAEESQPLAIYGDTSPAAGSYTTLYCSACPRDASYSITTG